MPVEEGDRYRIKEITFTGNKALSNSAALRRIFKIKDGDVFNRTASAKGSRIYAKLTARWLHQLYLGSGDGSRRGKAADQAEGRHRRGQALLRASY